MIKANGKGDTKFVVPDEPIPDIHKPIDGVKEKSNIVTNPNRTAVVDLERISKKYLMQYLEGSSWSVDFYNPIQGKYDPIKFFDSKTTSPAQQFTEILKLELRVTSPIERNQDSENKTYSLSGSATVGNSLPINAGALFIADIGSNRKGIFNVTESTRPSDNKISTYKISYTLLFEATPDKMETLRKCIVRSFHYVKERAWYGEDTLLNPSEYQEFIQIGERISEIEDLYVRRFYDKLGQSLAFPGKVDKSLPYPQKHYDVFLARFVKAVGLRSPGRDIIVYPHPTRELSECDNLFDLILTQQPIFLKEIKDKVSESLQVKSFTTMIHTNTIAFSRFTATRYFTDDFIGNAKWQSPWPEFEPFETVELCYRGNVGEMLPAFLPLSYKPYLLSEAFYDGSYASAFEYCLYCYMNKMGIPVTTVNELAKLCIGMPKTAQFYYMPLVYVLLKYAR